MKNFIKIIGYIFSASLLTGIALYIFFPSILDKIVAYMVFQVLCGLWPWGC